jgi:hypothetical protein
MLNPFFLQGSKTEQGLIQDLINEQLRMYGVEVYYLPRKYITEKTIIKEVIESAFDNAYPIEAYVENFDGYGDNTTILSKFGIQALNELTIIISKERFEEYITPLIKDQSNIKLSSRPKEGDIIYFPLGDRLFEIKFVEHEQPFYQLQKNYVYTLKCELFRYEDEVIDTGVSFIDDNIGGSGGEQDSAQAGVIQKLNMVGTGITASAITTLVNGGIRFFTVTNRGSGYINSPRVAISSAPFGGVTGIGSATLIGGIVVCTDSANPATKSVQSIEVINPGMGYTIAPKVLIFGDGSGATATSTIGDGIVGVITVTNAGGGYINSPSIVFTGISSVSAAATAVVSSAGSITQIRITNAGLGYTQPPSITIGNPSLSSLGSYTFNEIITGSTSGTTARVRSWSSITNVLEVSKVSGEFIAGETLVGTASSASRTLISIEVFAVRDGYSDNETIEEEADSIIDFSDANPFGMP